MKAEKVHLREKKKAYYSKRTSEFTSGIMYFVTGILYGLFGLLMGLAYGGILFCLGSLIFAAIPVIFSNLPISLPPNYHFIGLILVLLYWIICAIIIFMYSKKQISLKAWIMQKWRTKSGKKSSVNSVVSVMILSFLLTTKSQAGFLKV